jgi:hypothetical protein
VPRRGGKIRGKDAANDNRTRGYVLIAKVGAAQ